MTRLLSTVRAYLIEPGESKRASLLGACDALGLVKAGGKLRSGVTCSPADRRGYNGAQDRAGLIAAWASRRLARRWVARLVRAEVRDDKRDKGAVSLYDNPRAVRRMAESPYRTKPSAPRVPLCGPARRVSR